MTKNQYENCWCRGLSLKPHYAFEYWYSLTQQPRRTLIPRKHFHLTEMSDKARRRATTAMQWLIHESKNQKVYDVVSKKYISFKINFITLTLSATQQHADKFILHRMLRPFLKWMGRKGAQLYIWKAETQDNGNLHFHITTNHFIHWKSIRNKWNNLQARTGYLKKFFDKYGHHDPNSTDVHAVRNDKQIIGYMSKYITKADKFQKNQKEWTHDELHFYKSKLGQLDKSGKKLKRPVECAIWNCSNALTKKKYHITEEETEFKIIHEHVSKNSTEKKLNKGTLYEYNTKNTFIELEKMLDESQYNYS